MAKYYGKIGFGITVEDEPGIWKEKFIEKPYVGDAYPLRKSSQNTGVINTGLDISTEISIIADPYAYNHFSQMIYVWYMGCRWKINSIEVMRPRLKLSIGGLYNGNDENRTSEDSGSIVG